MPYSPVVSSASIGAPALVKITRPKALTCSLRQQRYRLCKIKTASHNFALGR